MGLMLPVNIAISIPNVDLTKLGKQIDAVTVGCPYLGAPALPVLHIAGKKRPVQIVGGLFEALQKGTMGGRHITAHLLQIHSQGIGAVTDTKTGVKRGHDRTLGAGFTSELLRPGIG